MHEACGIELTTVQISIKSRGSGRVAYSFQTRPPPAPVPHFLPKCSQRRNPRLTRLCVAAPEALADQGQCQCAAYAFILSPNRASQCTCVENAHVTPMVASPLAAAFLN